jgi:choline dehydrogenase-like flavoprotein
LLRKAFGKHRFPFVAEGPRDIHGPDVDLGANWTLQDRLAERYTAMYLLAVTEQLPDPENRVMLGDAVDALGCRKTLLHWRYTEADREAADRSQRALKRGLEQSGLGRFRMLRERGAPRVRMAGLHHHMCTTRMHDDPKRGVADGHGRVHGVPNLYVTGSSAFTTGGPINPTLTIVALAAKLAQRIRERAAASPDATRRAGSEVPR